MLGSGTAAQQRATAAFDLHDDSLEVLVEPVSSNTHDVASTPRNTRSGLISSWEQLDEMLAHLAAGNIPEARRALIRALRDH